MCNCKQKEYELLPELEVALNEKGGSNVEVYPDPTFGYIFYKPQQAAEHEVDELESEVYDPDKRRAVVNTLKSPYRWICRLELDYNGRKAIGTGTLISPRHVLTCGHNLFNNLLWRGAPREVTSIVVTPGYNCAGKIAAPFGHATSVKVSYPDEWKARLSGQFDYGLITLNSEIGKKSFPILGGKPLGYWGDKLNGDNTRIIPQTTAILENKPFNISGYPIDKCCFRQLTGKDPADPAADPHRKRMNPHLLHDCKDFLSGTRFKGDPQQMIGGAQFSSFGKVTHASPRAAPRLILYDLDTFQGHSGSPLWIRWQQYRNLIAIHTGSFLPTENRGIRITQEVLANVQSWM